jgi:hypothetical protein
VTAQHLESAPAGRTTTEEPRPRNGVEPFQPSGKPADRETDEDVHPNDEHLHDRASRHGRNGLFHRAEQIPAALLKNTLRLGISRALEPALLGLVDRVLHEAISRAVEAAPDAVNSDQVEQQLEQLLHTVVEEILDGILAGPAGAELEVHGRHAIAAAVHRDGDTVHSEGSAALSAVAEEVTRVLHNHRQDVIEVATHALTRAAADVAVEKVEAATETVDATPEQDGKEKNAPVAGEDESATENHAAEDARPRNHAKHPDEARTNDRGLELRDQLSDAGETLKHELSTQTQKLQQRLKQETGSAVKKGTQNQNLGRAPTGGHPSAGRSAPPGPSQAAPGTRRRK